ncbi:MAG TPA: primosomal protein DnaI [Bacillales bacterium]|nr:primosomal protein DnaI [Bacillales bacterium]
MESIGDALRKMAGGADFASRYEHLKTRVLSNEKVKAFLKAHPELSDAAVDRGIGKLYEFVRQSSDCERCPTLTECPNVMKGFHPRLYVHNGQIEIRYEACPLKRKADEIREQREMFRSLYVPREITEASMDKLDLSEGERLQAVQTVKTYVQRFEPGKTAKGLYLHGRFGVGKTYLLGAAANSLARKKQVRSLMVYTPDFFRDMKTSIQNQTVNEKIDYIKKIPVLILDDIGAETISPWIRDDVLGTVLQYRMMEKLPTLYTSNWDYDELETHLAYSQKYDAVDDMKAKRIMERIRHLTIAVPVGGSNRRAR